MPKLQISPWEYHRRKWSNCTRCKLHETRRHVVLARGSLPCDVLFCGEAPGKSEDVCGEPFIGEAGHLLDKIVEMAIAGRKVRTAFTNVVACIPIGEEGTKTAEPERECIQACAPRLVEIFKLANPRLVVCVGALAAKWLPKAVEMDEPDRPWIEIPHPAFILRLDLTQRPLAVKRAVITLSDAISGIV